MKATFVRFLLLCFIFFAPAAVFGQVVTGTPAFGTFKSFGPTTLNLANLNSQIAIPLVSKPGRGMPFTYTMTYDNSVWVSKFDDAGNRSWHPQPNFGWHGMSEAITGYLSYRHLNIPCGADTVPRHTVFTNFVYHDRFGVPHAFDATAVTDTNCSDQHDVPANQPATDGSGYVLNFTPNTHQPTKIGYVNGMVIHPPENDPNGQGSVTDVNGNVISSNIVNGEGTFTDTLGTPGTPVLTVSGVAPNQVSLTYTDSNGAQQSVVLNYHSFPIKTNFGCDKTAEYTSDTNQPLLTSIVFPDDSFYSFTYESTPGDSSSVTGRIASVTLPTGATINYAYTGGNNGIFCFNGNDLDGSNAGVKVTTADGGIWEYTRASKTGPGQTTTVTDPNGNQTVYGFLGIYQTDMKVYQGAAGSSPLLSTQTCYNTDNPDKFACQVFSPPITHKSDFTILDNNQKTWTDTFYDSHGQPTEIDEFDFGKDQVGPLTRKTTIKYASLGNPIFNRPSDVTVSDGNGTKVAQTTFAYDDKGNLTQKNQWLNTNNSLLTTTYNYFDTGMLQSVKDPGGHTSSFDYGCNGAYVTQTSMPKTGSTSHTVSAAYDCNTGLATSSTDQNKQVATLAYDFLLRPTQANLPDGGQTTFQYPDSNHIITQQTLNGSSKTFSEMELDGYGRTSRVITKNGETAPNDNDTQDSCYDSMGRLHFQSYPSQNAGLSSDKVCSGPGDTYSYDALGRIASVTHSDATQVQYSYTGRATQITDEGNATKRILQSDALGRLTQVCEVSTSQLAGNGGNPISCGLDIDATDPKGFVTSYSYDTLGNLTKVTQGGLTDRTYTYDSLGRMTEEFEPEWKSKTFYTYDNDGLLVKRERPAPNQTDPNVKVTTTYSYDELHRLINKSYSDGTSASDFFYDEATAGGIALHNSIGRMTHSTAHNSTAEVNDFDVMGRIVTSLQFTPSGFRPPFRLDYGYDPAGNVTSFANGTGTSFTYSYNSAGRLNGLQNSLKDTNHPALLNDVHYGAFGMISSALGNGVTETASYTPRGLLQDYFVQGVPPPPANQPPDGRVDDVRNVLDGTRFLHQNDTLFVGGWAADKEDGAPVAKVVIDIDGVPLGNAVEGDPRPDIVPQNSGFHFRGTIGTLIPGTHTVHATAFDSAGNKTILPGSPPDILQITVVVPPPPPPPPSAVPLSFVPVTPCRVVDTRNPAGPFGGPMLGAGETRGFKISDSACGIPATAQAFSLNVSVAPHAAALNILTMFPCGEARPNTSTLNSLDARQKGEAAIVRGGAKGSVCAFTTDQTDLILDINGYFVPATDNTALAFYPLTPCRVADTRGGPALAGGVERRFPVRSSSCNVPATAQAYSLNFSSIPHGPLWVLTTWPAGQTRPLVSTLNAPTGTVTANAAIVAAGVNGDISVLATDNSDLVIDINGYFAPPGPGGLSLFNVPPCRVLDTRNASGTHVSGTLNVNVSGNCGVPASAQAYAFNATVVPAVPLNFLTLWPQGTTRPMVSTLNAMDGAITSNMAIVPAANGGISALVTDPADLILDISAFFGPPPPPNASAAMPVQQGTVTGSPAQAPPSSSAPEASAPAQVPSPGSRGVSTPPPSPQLSATSTPQAAAAAGDTIYSFSLVYTGNGNIAHAEDPVNGDWNYSYDEFNRLVSAANGLLGQSYAYDAYGNRWQEKVTRGTASSAQFSFDNSNHISAGVIYDALGNVTMDGVHTYTYDAENRLIAVHDDLNSVAEYTYDAFGRRVSKTVPGSTVEYLYDLAGRVVAERDTATGNWNRSEIYAGGRHLATYARNTTYFRHSDWLGSSRVKTLPDGSVAPELCTNLPFGDGLKCRPSPADQSPSPNLFADYERDQETQLDHTMFRKYSSAQGRWTTPDPYLGSMNLANPQSLNRYAYVLNNPTNLLDPLGLNQASYEGCNVTDKDGKEHLDPNIKEEDCKGEGRDPAYRVPGGNTTVPGTIPGVIVIRDPFAIELFLMATRTPGGTVPTGDGSAQPSSKEVHHNEFSPDCLPETERKIVNWADIIGITGFALSAVDKLHAVFGRGIGSASGAITRIVATNPEADVEALAAVVRRLSFLRLAAGVVGKINLYVTIGAGVVSVAGRTYCLYEDDLKAAFPWPLHP